MTQIVTSIGSETADDRLMRLWRRREVAVVRLNSAIDAINSAQAEYDDANSAYETADHDYRLAIGG